MMMVNLKSRTLAFRDSLTPKEVPWIEQLSKEKVRYDGKHQSC